MGIKSKFIELDINKVEDSNKYVFSHVDPFVEDKLEANIKANGQLKNIVVFKDEDEKYYVIDGLSVLKILKKLNYEKVQVCIVKGCDPDLLSIQLNNSKNIDYVKIAKTFKKLLEKYSSLELEAVTQFYRDEIQSFPLILNFDFKRYDINTHNFLNLESNEEYF